MLWRRYRWKSLLNRIRNRNYYTVDSNKTEKLKNDFSLARCLYAKIKSTGPITVADYMKEVLINPLAGYYMHKDVFGNTGDFITSPEVSQIFGELIAIWFLNEWSKVGSPKPVQIVELGPGRGTLSQDILRVFSHFNCLKAASLHLVEVSPTLSDIQARNLCMQSHIVPDKNSIIYRQGISHEGIPVNWYRHLSDVPNAFTLLVAHEFFDALPIHKFQKTDRGFREVLIDIQPGEAIAFRYVIANEETPAVKSFLNKIEKREHVEVSPESIILMQQIAERLEQNGGFGLIADYGHEGNGTDTFRAFKKHKLHDPLIDPGSADLTADVDFSALKKAVTEKSDILTYGPITQREFLLNMGIEHRIKKLEESAINDKQRESLQFGYHMMIDDDKMGRRFKILALLPSVLKQLLEKYPPCGFGTNLKLK